MKNLGLIPKLIIAIILGLLIGTFMPKEIVSILATFNSIFGNFLGFIIPLIILGFVVCGIADLGGAAGKMLGLTTILAYGSTLISGFLAFFVSSKIFPSFIKASLSFDANNPEHSLLPPIFKVDMPPVMSVMSALILAFLLGLGIASIKGKTLYNMCFEFGIILFQFTIAGTLNKKNVFKLLKNQISGYLTALGTQSSAATIPVNLDVAEKNGVSKGVREFVIPLCATIHLSGSTITLTCCSIAVMLLNNMPISFTTFSGFIAMLGITMVAAPGVPGGAVMAALGVLQSNLGFNEAQLALMIALYIAQDSFGTACNISGDNAIALIVERFKFKNK